jgi:oligopeptide/dipeptide ABC transporter ATP-binding protein
MLGCSLVPGYQLRPIAGQAPSPARLPEGCAFAARCPHARPVCANEPALEALADGRSVRCLRWRELSLPGAA